MKDKYNSPFKGKKPVDSEFKKERNSFENQNKPYRNSDNKPPYDKKFDRNSDNKGGRGFKKPENRDDKKFDRNSDNRGGRGFKKFENRDDKKFDRNSDNKGGRGFKKFENRDDKKFDRNSDNKGGRGFKKFENRDDKKFDRNSDSKGGRGFKKFENRDDKKFDRNLDNRGGRGFKKPEDRDDKRFDRNSDNRGGRGFKKFENRDDKKFDRNSDNRGGRGFKKFENRDDKKFDRNSDNRGGRGFKKFENRDDKKFDRNSDNKGGRGFKKFDFKNTDKRSSRKSEEKDNRGDKEQEKNDVPQNVRLNRYIANAGICSRREADKLIQRGEITINGKVMREMGYKVQNNDLVKRKGKRLQKEKNVYVLLNKPKDFITTVKDTHDRKTVMDLVKNACKERIYPVGRLDRPTTGLLLFTNDGDLAKQLTHPSFHIQKIYRIELNKAIKPDDFEAILEGFELEDGFIAADSASILTLDRKVLGIELHSGRNRIVRRIFRHLGYEVERLDRTLFAGLSKERLPRGKWRHLSDKEVIKLKFFTGKKKRHLV